MSEDSNAKRKHAKRNNFRNRGRRSDNMQSNNNQQENHMQEHAQIPAERNEQYQNSSGEGRSTSIAQDEFLFQHPMDAVWEAHSGALKPQGY